MNSVIETVTAFADKAHGEQKRKYTPERYIVHPIRVMTTCKRVTDDICMLSAALLHDVLEDTKVTTEEMRAFLNSVMTEEQTERTLSLVIDLTDVYVKEDFPNLNRRERKAKESVRLETTSSDSQTIKYADIIDNCREIVKHDRNFARVFLNECKANLKNLNKGNRELYDEALELVKNSISTLSKR